MWIDAHCHLSDERVFSNITCILQDCEAVGITRFILGGVDPSEWARQTELDARFPGRFFKVFGLHPWWVDALVERLVERNDRNIAIEAGLEELQRQLSSVIAIGEAGLDGARGRLKRSGPEQIQVFRGQLDLAKKKEKPLALHVVRAHPHALQILGDTPYLGLKGMVHSFSGTVQDARRYLEMGWLLSFSAHITHPSALPLLAVLRECPADRLVFETDAPDQPPFGHSEANHTPFSLFKVLEQASLVRGESVEDLMRRSQENLARTFGLAL